MKQPQLDKSSFVPIYHQLYQHFAELITSGQLVPGDVLPTETDFASQLGISRMTVRRVISELAAADMVYTIKGKGTFVAEPKLDEITFRLNQRFDDLEQREKVTTRLLECRIIKADLDVSKRLCTSLGSLCLFCRMITQIGELPLIYKTFYAIYSKRAPLIEKQLKDMSLTNIASQHSVNGPSRTKRVLMSSIAKYDEPEILQINENTPVFFMAETIYDQENKIIAWGKSIIRGDLYRFVSYNGWNLDELKKTEGTIRYV
jgi:GntR family transcriptional regulator